MPVNLQSYNLTILGCGVMGTAVLSAILKSEVQPYPASITACVSRESQAKQLKETYGDKISVSFGAANAEAVKKANVIVLGLKPYMFDSVTKSMISSFNGNQLVISLMAGWTIDQIKHLSPYVARVMTNTPAKFGCGTAVVSFSSDAESYEDLVMKLIGPVGLPLKLPEKNMDAATALVGSGPAFCLLMMEALVDGGVRMGIPYATARECAAKVMEGTAKMALETGEHPAALKSAVCTPGGTTIGGLLVMEERGVRSGISRAVEEAANIASALGKK